MNGLQNLDLHNTAFFFDFDGTLVDIALDAQKIILDKNLQLILTKLAEKTSDALAIISGRTIANLEEFLPQQINKAGIHGAQIKDAASNDGSSKVLSVPSSPSFKKAKEFIFTQLDSQKLPGALWAEDKKLAITIHYRQADSYLTASLKTKAFSLAEKALALCADDYELQLGKAVVELKPKNKNKGTALDYFMAKPNFQKRTPLCFGDDLTDEAMFAAAKKYNGICYKIGTSTKTTDRTDVKTIDNPTTLRNKLQRLLEIAN